MSSLGLAVTEAHCRCSMYSLKKMSSSWYVIYRVCDRWGMLLLYYVISEVCHRRCMTMQYMAMVTDNFGLFTEIAACKFLRGWQSYGLKPLFIFFCSPFFSFLSVVCIFIYFSAAFCMAHCALDLARDHAPQKCPRTTLAWRDYKNSDSFAENRNTCIGGCRCGLNPNGYFWCVEKQFSKYSGLLLGSGIYCCAAQRTRGVTLARAAKVIPSFSLIVLCCWLQAVVLFCLGKKTLLVVSCCESKFESKYARCLL